MLRLKNIEVKRLNGNKDEIKKVEKDLIKLKRGALHFQRDRKLWDRYNSVLSRNVRTTIQGIREHRRKLNLTHYSIASLDRRYKGLQLTIKCNTVRTAYRYFLDSLRAHRQKRTNLEGTVARKYLADQGEYVNLAGLRSYNYETHTKSTVYIEFSQILKLQKAKKIGNLYKHKKPLTDELHFGIELEFISPLSKTELAIKLSDLDVAQFIRLTTDGSVRPGTDEHGLEINLLCPESRRDEIIEKVTKLAQSVGGRVNTSCGMHLHIDARHLNRENLYQRLVAAQRILYAMQPSSRRAGDHFNQYCKFQTTRSLDKARRGSRYVGINASSLSKYGTIELRMHAGTLDAEKIKNWVDLTRLIALSDEVAPKRALTNVDNFVKKFKLDSKLAAYVKSRISKFENHAQVEEV